MQEHIQLNPRWGGRAGRYALHKGKVLRIIDPITSTPQQFSLDFIYEAWLIHRFDSAVKGIQVGPHHLGEQSDRYQNTIHLDVSYHDGKRVLELLSWAEIGPRQISEISAAASELGATFRCRTRTQIRAFPVLLKNLRHFRQVMQMHGEARDWPELKEVVTKTDGLSRGLLDELVQYEEPEFIDAGLGFLLQAGAIAMDLKEVAHGHGTLITRR